jgi:hypothetical protein
MSKPRPISPRARSTSRSNTTDITISPRGMRSPRGGDCTIFFFSFSSLFLPKVHLLAQALPLLRALLLRLRLLEATLVHESRCLTSCERVAI